MRWDSGDGDEFEVEDVVEVEDSGSWDSEGMSAEQFNRMIGQEQFMRSNYKPAPRPLQSDIDNIPMFRLPPDVRSLWCMATVPSRDS